MANSHYMLNALLLITTVVMSEVSPPKLRPLDLALAALFAITLDLDRNTAIEASRLGYIEKNKILGKYPTESQINWYTGSVLIATLTISQLAPRPFSELILIGGIFIESIVLYKQVKLGLSLKL